MLANICGFVVLLAISLGISSIIYKILRKSLSSLLDEVIKLQPGTTFYLRLFAIGLFYIALSSCLDTNFNFEEGTAFMEYVWKVANGLSTLFGYTCLYILGYLTLVTILVAVLRYKHD